MTLTERLDSRFAEAEAEVDRGNPWRFREPGIPNPLTIEVLEWSMGTTKFGPAEFLNGLDQSGTRWSVLVGGVVLSKRLVEGTVEAWDDKLKQFVVVDTLGRARPGEIVSIKYTGDVEGPNGPYPNFRVSRKPPATATEPGASAAGDDEDLPF